MLTVELQRDDALPEELLQTCPNLDFFENWCQRTVDFLRVSPEAKLAEHLEISVMLSSSSAIQTLNRDYREKDSATNVLSFPAELPELGGLQALGDIVFGVEVIRSEAMAQNKSVSDHWAHLTVHGVLHLAGLDHDNDTAAAAMEAAEIQILLAAGVDNPYLLASDTQAENP